MDAALSGKALVVGGNRGLGLAVVQNLVGQGVEVIATARKSNPEMEAAGCKIVAGIDVAEEDSGQKLVEGVTGHLGEGCTLDYLIVIAGYFTTETFDELNWAENRKMYEICALGPLRVTQALVKAGLIKEGGKVGLITSEGGSISLRSEAEGGGNYGHHMSKCAQNMMGKLLAWDLKPLGIGVVMLHPGFLKTSMTGHYAHLYEELGAVTPEEAVPHILKAVEDVKLETTGKFIAPMGSSGLGLGVWALPDPDSFGPFSELPW